MTRLWDTGVAVARKRSGGEAEVTDESVITRSGKAFATRSRLHAGCRPVDGFPVEYASDALVQVNEDVVRALRTL